MDYIKIDGKSYDVLITKVTESFDILNGENAGRTIAIGAPMTLDPLGTWYGHEITFQRKPGHEKEYDDLWDYVSQPRYNGIYVDLVHNQQTLAYLAYVSSGERELQRIDTRLGKVYWKEFSLKITPMEAQVKPE